ncbi:Uncharacterised protein [Burkholderia pseudomallei]|nr:Uncharacterised protein [Burkholderia pseudomallei]
MPRDDRLQRRVDVLRHARRVAAHVEMRALLEPCPQRRPLLEHAVLHVDLLRLVARERDIEPREEAVRAHLRELVAVIEIGVRVLLAEEQPIAPLRAARAALVQKAPERRDARARADHHDRRVAARGRAKVRGFLHEYRHGRVGRAVREERRRDALALPPPVAVAHGRYRQVDLAAMRARARRDRVEARLQALEHADELGRRQLQRKLVQHVGELLAPQPVLQVRLAIVAEQARERVARTAARRDERERVRMRPRDVEMLRERIGQPQLAHARDRHRRVRLQPRQRQQLVDELRAVRRPHAERVARFVFDRRAVRRQRHAARVLRRTRLVEPQVRDEPRRGRTRLRRNRARRDHPVRRHRVQRRVLLLDPRDRTLEPRVGGRLEFGVAVDALDEPRRAELGEPRVEPAAVAAERVVVAVAEREHRIAQPVGARRAGRGERRPERLAVVRRVAVAERARHQQRVLRLRERRGRIVGHARDADLEARVHQLRRVALGQRFDVARLRRPQQHDLRPRAHDPHAARRAHRVRRAERRAAEQPGEQPVEPQARFRIERRARGQHRHAARAPAFGRAQPAHEARDVDALRVGELRCARRGRNAEQRGEGVDVGHVVFLGGGIGAGRFVRAWGGLRLGFARAGFV